VRLSDGLVAVILVTSCEKTSPEVQSQVESAAAPQERRSEGQVTPTPPLDPRSEEQDPGEEPAAESPVSVSASDVLARYEGRAFERGASPEALAAAWKPVTVVEDESHGGHAFRLGNATLGWFASGDEVCVVGKGIEGPEGIEVGTRLRDLPHRDDLGCEVSGGNELLQIGDWCPSVVDSKTMLVCELDDPFRRVFFEVAEAETSRLGDDLRGAELTRFDDVEVVALHVIGGQRPPGSDETEHRPAPKAASHPGVVLAQNPRVPGRALKSGTLTTVEDVASALEAFDVRKRRHYGLFIYQGAKKVALIMEDERHPITGVTLLGPGLADARGIEVGQSFSAIADLEDLTCEIAADADWDSYVVCSVGEVPFSRYIFVKEISDERYGDALTRSQAQTLVGKTKLTAIETGVGSAP
jgi:hypothetical protein